MLVAAAILLISSCGYLENKGLLPEKFESDQSLTEEELEQANEMIVSSAIGMGEPLSNWMLTVTGEGTLIYTVKNAKIVHNFSQNGLSIDNVYGSPYVEVDGSTYKYPDFLEENTDLVDGCSLLVIDVAIENVDANGNYFPDTNDPDLFRGDSGLFLCNLEQAFGTDEEGQFFYTSADYFSLLNSEPVHPMAFRLKKGKTIDVQIGFFLDDNWSELDALFLSNSSGQYFSSNEIVKFVDLNLSDEENDA
jgi:hypothetical protein